MAEKKSTGRTIAKGLVAAGLVAGPAFGGQLVSAGAKAAFPSLANATAGSRVAEFFADLGGGAVVGALEVGIAMLISGKGSVSRVLPFAIGGAVIGAALPVADDLVDSAVSEMFGAPAPLAQLQAAQRKQLAPMTNARIAMARKPGGVDAMPSQGIGGLVPGGAMAVQKTGGIL